MLYFLQEPEGQYILIERGIRLAACELYIMMITAEGSLQGPRRGGGEDRVASSLQLQYRIHSSSSSPLLVAASSFFGDVGFSGSLPASP